MLDHIRNNTVGSTELQLLNTRYGTQIEQSEADMYITLATRRDNVDYINDKKLAELPGDPVTFYGEIMGDFPESSLPTSQELVLKPGAQIIFIKNDFDRRWVNGTIGVIETKWLGTALDLSSTPLTAGATKSTDAGATVASKEPKDESEGENADGDAAPADEGTGAGDEVNAGENAVQPGDVAA